MSSYLEHTRRIAAATPRERNRVVDFWRATAIGMVVIGHWMVAGIWKQPDGEVALLSALEYVPYAAWVTWLVQVMPVFFLAGGYANARGMSRVLSGEQRRRDWITLRTRRLWSPVTPLLVVWVVLIVIMRLFLEPRILSSGSMSATVPLWFLAVYLVFTALAPFTFAWWRRWRWWSVTALVAAALAVDLARFQAEVPGIGWSNYLFVWGAVHQVGYWWSERDAGPGIRITLGWTVCGTALAVLIAVTWLGWYPVPMIGVPGVGLNNMAPPTGAIGLLGMAQAGLIWGTAPGLGRLMQRPRAWHTIVSLSGVIMTVYLWHLSAMTLVAVAGLNLAGGAPFELEPGTTAWWLTRPLWIAALLIVLAGLVAVFARFEWRVSDAPLPRTRRMVTAGVVLVAGSAGAVAMYGLTGTDGVIHWIIPGAALLGAFILGALPGRRRTPETPPPLPASR